MTQRHYLSAFIATIIFPLISLSTHGESSQEKIQDAKKEIVEYKALRRVCTVATSRDKHQCFKELEARTERYKVAKLILRKNNNSQSLYLGFVK